MSRRLEFCLHLSGFLLLVAGAVHFCLWPSLGFPFQSGYETLITALLVLIGYALIAAANSNQVG